MKVGGQASAHRYTYMATTGLFWGIALLVPFSVFIVLIRLASDRIVPGNLKNATAADYAYFYTLHL